MNLMVVHAREKAGLPDEWDIFKWESFPKSSQPTEAVVITGAIAPKITKGKRAGWHDWKKRDKATEQQVLLTVAEHEAWLRKWEESTGKCAECTGTGHEWAGWHHETGTSYRTCRKCKGSGNKPSPVQRTA